MIINKFKSVVVGIFLTILGAHMMIGILFIFISKISFLLNDHIGGPPPLSYVW